jgi:type I restriction enzyme S subunit
MAMNQSCYGIIGQKGWKPYFVHFLLKEAVIGLQANTHGSVFDTITRSTFDAVQVIKPGQGLAAAFDSVVCSFMDRIKANLHENRTLAQLRDLLLPKLISGEIRLHEAEKRVGEEV